MTWFLQILRRCSQVERRCLRPRPKASLNRPRMGLAAGVTTKASVWAKPLGQEASIPAMDCRRGRSPLNSFRHHPILRWHWSAGFPLTREPAVVSNPANLLVLLSHKIDTPDFAPPNGRILKR